MTQMGELPTWILRNNHIVLFKIPLTKQRQAEICHRSL